jgi:hypothetical protein
MEPDRNSELFSDILPFFRLFNRAYCYFFLCYLFSSIQRNRELSWPELLYILFFFAVPCVLDYFQLAADA